MIKNLIKIAINFLIFIALQVVLLNNIHLFRVTTLFLYIYVIIKIPMSLTRSWTVVISFLLGLIIDLFSNTIGMHAAACTLAGFFREPLIKAYTEREVFDYDTPSWRLGMGAYTKLVFSLVILHHVTLFLIESLSLFDPLFLTLRIVSSVILTSLCIFVLDSFNVFRKNGAI